MVTRAVETVAERGQPDVSSGRYLMRRDHRGGQRRRSQARDHVQGQLRTPSRRRRQLGLRNRSRITADQRDFHSRRDVRGESRSRSLGHAGTKSPRDSRSLSADLARGRAVSRWAVWSLCRYEAFWLAMIQSKRPRCPAVGDGLVRVGTQSPMRPGARNPRAGLTFLHSAALKVARSGGR